LGVEGCQAFPARTENQDEMERQVQEEWMVLPVKEAFQECPDCPDLKDTEGSPDSLEPRVS